MNANVTSYFSDMNMNSNQNVDSKRSLYRCAKEVFRFVATTVFVTNVHFSPVYAASIIVNCHTTPAARASRRSSAAASTSALSRRITRGELNTWNYRSLSLMQLSSPPSTPFLSRLSNENAVNVKASSSRRGGGAAVKTSAADIDCLDKEDVYAIAPASSGRRKRLSKQEDEASNFVDDPFDDPNYQPTLAEMRSQLGPAGLLIANAVEVGVTTAGSYISGGIFGYFIGGIMGVPTLFRNSQSSPPPGGTIDMKIPTGGSGSNSGIREIQRRFGKMNSKAAAQAKSWAQLSAAFSGFHALTRVCRGGVEDKWNGIIGSSMTGAYLSRKGGPQAMLQGATTYAGFTYFMDVMFSPGGKKNNNNTGMERDFDFTDAPVTVDDRGF